jgi:predicted ATPase
LQERLRGQLMLALYRAGRQSDALAAYRQASDLLREQLGLEPSRALQELERSILQHDETVESPVRAPLRRHTNLPTAATAFLGRVRELAEVTALLRAGVRLLTLTGAGGSGKTRLAVRVAEGVLEDFRDGVWFVGFADITDPELIATTVCQALDLAERPELTPARRLRDWLREREVLLVLDNLEQLTGGTGALGELLAGCPSVALLVTSREPLHLASERQYEVSPLGEVDAVELFITRAQAVASRVSMSRELGERICERLDRLPLAIELAAARTKAFSPREILARLDRSLPLLTTGPRDAPRRQQTLKATIDWSYDLLNQEEQRLFVRMAVFAGGCTLPAAEAVCGAKLDTLQALVDRSLVRTDTPATGCCKQSATTRSSDSSRRPKRTSYVTLTPAVRRTSGGRRDRATGLAERDIPRQPRTRATELQKRTRMDL